MRVVSKLTGCRVSPFVAAIVMVVLCVGCASKRNQVSPSAQHVQAANRVLAALAEGLRQRNADAVARLWRKDLQDEARREVVTGFEDPGHIDLSFSLIGIRAMEGKAVSQVSWSGVWGAREVSGTFEMELGGPNGEMILSIRGDNPLRGGRPPAKGLEGLSPPGL